MLFFFYFEFFLIWRHFSDTRQVKRISKISATTRWDEENASRRLQFSGWHHNPSSSFNWLHISCYVRLPSVTLLRVAMVLWSKFRNVAAPWHSSLTVWMNTHSRRTASASVLPRYDGWITRTGCGAAHQFCFAAARVRAGHILLAGPPQGLHTKSLTH